MGYFSLSFCFIFKVCCFHVRGALPARVVVLLSVCILKKVLGCNLLCSVVVKRNRILGSKSCTSFTNFVKPLRTVRKNFGTPTH